MSTALPFPSHTLSPHCVLYPNVNGTTVMLEHGLYGSRFELSADAMRHIVSGTDGDPAGVGKGAPAAEREAAVAQLVAERVLVSRAPVGPAEGDPFHNRLDPLAQAMQRRFNEGGYVPDTLNPGDAPAMTKSALTGDELPLATHEPSGAAAELASLLAARRSVREYADRPIEKRALEQFLQLSARAYGLVEGSAFGAYSLRNYPGGGARYPLELYPVVYDVDGLEPGAYRYHPFHHSLVRVPTTAEQRDAVRRVARQTMGAPGTLDGEPAVLLIVTAVFARTCWKYRGIPYHLILQEVGALYQTMYLSATATGLAPCAVGAFPERAVAEVLGLDSRDEAQVGLFALGAPAIDLGDLVVESVERREGSPFSTDPTRASVALRLRDGRVDVRDVTDVRLETSANGGAFCLVLRGRHRARLDAACAALIRRWQS